MLATSGNLYALYGLDRIGVQQGSTRPALSRQRACEQRRGYYPHTDALGSVRQWSNSAGNLVGNTSYDPFGVPIVKEGTLPTGWGYAGEWTDPSGLQYLRARWYNPAIGRFTQVDPFAGVLSQPGTLNPYIYGLNNPVMYTDPSGESALLTAALIGGVIGGVAGGVGYALENPGQTLGEYVRNAEFQRAVGVGAASGAVAGVVGWAVPGLLPVAGNVWGAIGLGMLSGSLASGAGQITTNLLTPCMQWYNGVERALFVGAISGGIAGGVGYGFRQWLANRIKPISPPTNPRNLHRAMGDAPQGMQNPHAHHELPWKFREWFAGPRRGLNINDPSFGRWVEGTPPGHHQNWSWEYNNAWETFIQQNPTADRWQVLAFLKHLRSSGRFP